MSTPEPLTIATPHGDARVHLRPAAEPAGALVLGHGAGGGVNAPDLQAAATAAAAAGWTVALAEQPYRVAGRRSPSRAAVLDEAWHAMIDGLRRGALGNGVPLVTGGRSSGARVACRTAAVTGAAGVLCLAFPLQPPPRRATGVPSPDRLGELDAVTVPVLVVQGAADRFGCPPAGAGREVVIVPGDHGLKRDHAAIGAAIGVWLARLSG